MTVQYRILLYSAVQDLTVPAATGATAAADLDSGESCASTADSADRLHTTPEFHHHISINKADLPGPTQSLSCP